MLQSFLGPSPLSTTGGIIGLFGLIMIVLGLVFDKDEVWKAGVGIATAGSTLIGFVARDNRSSEVAHQESLDQIEETKRDVEAVPAAVTKAVEASVPQAVEEVMREERRR